MSSQSTGPGKTAPKLLHDLYIHDPARVIKDYRVLVDAPPPWDPDQPPPRLLDRNCCKHDYITKAIQSQRPALDERPVPGTTIWKVASVCIKCRLHADITIDFRHSRHSICPNSTHPLHHFRFIGQDRLRQSTVHSKFTCTSSDCNAEMSVDYHPPVLDPAKLELLTNEDNLMRRYRAVLDDDPDRKDVVLTTPVQALYRLKRYTDDSLNPTFNKRVFPAHNKKFLGAFGDDCAGMLQDLGFSRSTAENGNDMITLPDPGLTTSALQPDPKRRLLENLSIELQILIDQRCARDGDVNPSARDAWRQARPDLERLLSAQAYDKLPGRVLNRNEVDHPCLGALGAVGDFSDRLIEFAYRRQTAADPDNKPYYFECLREIARGRNSEHLITIISELEADGVVGKRELEQAYFEFTGERDLTTNRTVDEEHLVNLYRAIATDSSRQRKNELRGALLAIGKSRDSRRILDAASDTIDTYDEALAFLGASNDMGDEAIIALYGTKIGDSTENSDHAKRAVELIAQHRNSNALMGFINTGELNAYELTIDEACDHLRIKFDPDMDEEVLRSTFDYARIDNAGRRTEQAIETVQKAVDARRRLVAAGPAPGTWPVGLESHGNTCYLNSLLQYYFTIKPLRDIVLDIDQYKFDLTQHDTKSERVQSIHLKRYEIEAYQKFADHLKHLFERMIKAPGPRVRPDTELVCGAFLTPAEVKAVEAAAKTEEPAQSEDTAMSGVDESGVATSTGPIEIPHASTKDQVRRHSSASSITLIDEGQNAVIPSSQTLVLTPPDSPKTQPVEPQSKPPLPPRPELQRAKTQLELAEDAAKRQQDVAEVMEDLLRRLRAAIKPLGQDKEGEQLDQLRELFNMRFAETIIAEGALKTKPEEDATNILLNVPFEPTDIYSALDRVIDRRADDIAGKSVELYRAFTALPPLLQISVPRIALRDGSAVKVTHSLRLEETLYMDRYCDSPEVLEIRKQCWETRKHLSSLRAQKELIQKTPIGDVQGPDAIEMTAEFISVLSDANEGLESVGIDPIVLEGDLSKELHEEAGRLRSSLVGIDEEIQTAEESLKGVFDAHTKQKYRLYAVFFHRGGAGGGHYWMNMFDFKANMWRKYNDETVTEFTDPIDDILNANKWEHGTPTYAVYVRDEVKDDLVEPVRREPEQEAEEQLRPQREVESTQDDVQMTDDAQERADGQAEDSVASTQGVWDEPNGGYAESPQQVPHGGW